MPNIKKKQTKNTKIFLQKLHKFNQKVSAVFLDKSNNSYSFLFCIQIAQNKITSNTLANS